MKTPRLKFHLNPRVIAVHSIKGSDDASFMKNADKTSIVDFQNAAWSLGKDAYDFIRYGISELDCIEPGALVEKLQDIESFLFKVVALPEMKVLKDETDASLVKLQAEWEKNLEKSSQKIANIMGKSVTGIWDVYLTHPALKSGRNTGSGILWSYRNDWTNYSTVYLWHEILHSLFKHSNIEHAIIELIADNELRVRLNGGTYPPLEGHDFLKEMETKLLPEWRAYLLNTERDIERFTQATLNSSSE